LGKPFILHPNEFVLAATLEWIRMPKRLAGYVTGKSSWGRRGLVIETAPGVHPRYIGCITLEVANVGEIPITIIPGTEICQLFIHRVEGDPADTPSGSFACRRQPTLGTIKLNPLVKKIVEEDEKAQAIKDRRV
jgi:dCTP deaminase